MSDHRPLPTFLEQRPIAPDKLSQTGPARRLALSIALATSVIVHATLIGLGVVRLEWPKRSPPDTLSIPITLVPDPDTGDKGKKPPPVAQSNPGLPPPTAAPPQPPPPPQPVAPAAAVASAQAPPPQQAPSAPAVASVPTKMKVSQSELDALRAQVQRCWNPGSGWTDPGQVTVVVDVSLNAGGGVAGRPTVIEFPASPFGVAAAQNAVRAVMQCAPYHLPASRYDDWREVQIRLTPGG